MRFEVEVRAKLKFKAADKQMREAGLLGLRDVTVDTTAAAIRGSPWLTGNNRRSIAAEVSQMGLVATGGEGEAGRIVDDALIEAALYSTSGYGGYLETGTYKMEARPYFKPAMDLNFTEGKVADAIRRHLE